MTHTASTRDYGDGGLLVECRDLAAVLALYTELRETRTAGILDIVPAARTITVIFDPSVIPLAKVGAWIDDARRRATGRSDTEKRRPRWSPPSNSDDSIVTIPVEYTGADLAEVAELCGLDDDALVTSHTSRVWTVAFSGFSPGFGYLVSDRGWQDVPRRATPRTVVPVGSVALAGEFSGVYPRASPGGWQLIGRTDAELWNPQRPSPALLVPGTRVRFRAV